MEKSTTPAIVTTVATINNKQIVVIENGEKRVAVKPICEILGIDFDWQNKRIKEDEILSQLHKISYAVGADGKEREMATIPFKFIFGWLFSINTKKVAPEAREAMVRYKLECYNALYEHFAEMDEYLRWRNKLAEEKFQQVETAREQFKLTKAKLDSLKKEFAEVRQVTFEEFRQNKAQLVIDFKEEEGGNNG